MGKKFYSFIGEVFGFLLLILFAVLIFANRYESQADIKKIFMEEKLRLKDLQSDIVLLMGDTQGGDFAQEFPLLDFQEVFGYPDNPVLGVINGIGYELHGDGTKFRRNILLEKTVLQGYTKLILADPHYLEQIQESGLDPVILKFQ